MILTATISINQTKLLEGILAAFINNVCRGIANSDNIIDSSWYYSSVNGNLVIEISIYGNASDIDKQIIFKAYSNGVIYPLESSDLTIFRYNESITPIGTDTSPINFVNTSKQTLPIIKKGWTYISFYLKNSTMSLSDINIIIPSGLTIISNPIYTIKSSKSKSDYYYNYTDPSTGTVFTGWSGVLRTLKLTAGYKFQNYSSNNNVTLEFNGLLQSNVSIDLVKGWNWIGSPLNISKNISVIIGSDKDIMKNQTVSSTYYIADISNGILTSTWSGVLKTIIPGIGYIYYSNNIKTIIIN